MVPPDDSQGLCLERLADWRERLWVQFHLDGGIGALGSELAGGERAGLRQRGVAVAQTQEGERGKEARGWDET